MDKSITNAFYEIEIEPRTGLPVTIRITLLTGRKGETKVKAARIVGGRHVAFHFEYKLRTFGQAGRLTIPREASRLLAKL